MKNIKKDIEKEGTAAAIKLQLESFLEVIERDILSLLNLAKQRMIAPKNEKRTQGITVDVVIFMQCRLEQYASRGGFLETGGRQIQR